MNAASLLALLQSDKETRNSFFGIAWADSKFKISKFPASVIFNTDKYKGKGIHWCVTNFVDRHNCEYFDPFGLPPNVPNSHNFIPVLLENSKNIQFSSKQVQDINASTCGFHCAYFIFLRSRGISMHEILEKYYTDNITLNDETVKNFIQHQQKFLNLI